MKNFMVVLILLSLPSCYESSSLGSDSYVYGSGDDPTDEVPTGAKVVVDEFGQEVLVDEECGGRDDQGYGDTFQSALLRDAAYVPVTQVSSTVSVSQPTFAGVAYFVDGANVFRSQVWNTPTGVTISTLSRWAPWIGSTSAIQATDDIVIVGTVDGYIHLLNPLNAQGPAIKVAPRVLDLALTEKKLVVAAGASGLQVFDLDDVESGKLINAKTVNSAGFFNGVRNSGLIVDGFELIAASACSFAGYFAIDGDTMGDGLWSPTLSHPNAKDADLVYNDNNRIVLAIANNGGGLWAVPVDSLLRDSFDGLYEYSPDDPAFYANSVVRGRGIFTSSVYLAAGNQALQQFDLGSVESPPPPVVIPRDPIGVEYWNVGYDASVVGLGNFRQIGERTALLANSSLEQVEHETEIPLGSLQVSHSTGSQPVTWLTLTTFTERDFRQYRAAVSAISSSVGWQQSVDDPSIDLADDKVLTIGSFREEGDARFWGLGIHTVSSSSATEQVGTVEYDRDGNGHYALAATASDNRLILPTLLHQWLHQEKTDLLPGNRLPVIVQGVEVSREQMELSAPCGLARRASQSAFATKNQYRSDGQTLVWCTRKNDPDFPGFHGLKAAGTTVFRCQITDSQLRCDRVTTVPEFNVLTLIELGDGWLMLSGDRRSYSYQWVQYSHDLSLVSRTMFLGRSIAWQAQEDGSVLWVNDELAVYNRSATGYVQSWMGEQL